MDRAVQIAGTTYESVPSVTIPTTGGGEASFVEISDTTALAADVASGKFFYTADGIKTQGTASGGGTVVIYKDSDGYIVIGSEDCGVDGLVSKDSDGYIVIPEELITEIKLQGKTTTPTEEYQAIYPDSGYDGLEYVGVDPIPSAYADVTDTTAVATDVAAGKIFYTSEGVRTSGTASGGGGDDIWSGMVDRTISQAIDSMGSISTIGPYAFAYCDQLTVASFPSVTNIESFAFVSCHELSSVYMPSVTSVGGSAFQRCSKLLSVDFPKLSYVAPYAFFSCSGLSTVRFSELSSIASSIFASCSSLTSVDIPNAQYIGSYAFARCPNLRYVDFPKLSDMGGNAFASCGIQEAVFPLLSSVPQYAFDNCSLMKSAILENATGVGWGTFRSCWSLVSVSLPVAHTLGSSAFTNCNKLKTIVLPDAVYIYNYAFLKNESLSTVILGYNNYGTASGFLSTYAFSGCYRLMSLYLLRSKVYSLNGVNVFTATPISTFTTYTSGVNGSIFVPESLYNSYITATNWSTYASRFVSLTDAQVQHVIDYGTHEME